MLVKSFTWSFSALTTYENCPKKYFHLYVEKDFKERESEAMSDGKAIHAAFFKRVINGTEFPLPMRNFEKLAIKLENAPGEKHGEMKIAINRKFEPVTYFAGDVWCRAVVDLLIVKGGQAVIIDYKTGKRRDEWTQLKMSTGVLSRWMPEIDEFKLTFVWTRDMQMTAPISVRKADLKGVWADLLPRVHKMEESRATTNFPARKNPLCTWCPVSTCPHHP